MTSLIIYEAMGTGTPCYFVATPPVAISGEAYPHKIMPIASLEEAISFALTLNRIMPNGRCEVGQVDIDSTNCSQAELEMLGRRARVKALRLLVRMSAGHYPESVVRQRRAQTATTQHSIQGEV